MMFNSILCRYHEIATKGNNRIMFERCLVDNIHCLFKKAGFDYPVRRVRGRVWIEKKDGTLFDAEELKNISQVLQRTFGIESFSPAIKLASDMDVLEAKVKDAGASCIELQAVNDEMHERFYGKAGFGNAGNFVMKVKWFE